MNPIIRIIAALTLLLQFASHSFAAATFHIDVDTSSLMGNSNAPFSLDFQLNSGGGAVGNFATISNFTFGGGSAAAIPAISTFGLASGSLASSVSLQANAANPFNEFYQGFVAGTTLGFDVLLTTSVSGPTPDAFAFAILAGDASPINITTTGFADQLVFVNIDSATPTVQTFAGSGDFTGVTVSAVPEPETILLLSVGLAVIGFVRRRRA